MIVTLYDGVTKYWPSRIFPNTNTTGSQDHITQTLTILRGLMNYKYNLLYVFICHLTVMAKLHPVV